jgi:hypothetical protein
MRGKGVLTRRDAARRVGQRTSGGLTRVAERRSPVRSHSRAVRHAPRRLRPDVADVLDLLPVVVH